MRIQDLVSMAWKNLMSRKLRTFLTLLGVIIGTTAIVVMISLGFGIRSSMEEMINGMGDITMLQVSAGVNETGKVVELTDNKIKELKKVDHVLAVSPQLRQSFSFKTGRFQNEMGTLIGIDADAMDKFGWKLEEGRLFRENSEDYVFGGKAASDFYDPKRPNMGDFDDDGNWVEPEPPFNPIHAKIEMKPVDESAFFGNMSQKSSTPKKSKEINVIGILEAADDYSRDNYVFTSLTNFRKVTKDLDLVDNTDGRKNTYDQVFVKVDDRENVETVQQEIKMMGLDVYGLFSALDSISQSTLTFQLIFGGIGAISFLVAAIGIANTMIMSIYERTKEIGVMKVIGASIKDIQRLFLVEAGFIGLLGGAFGILLSLILSGVMNLLANSVMAQQMGADAVTKISIIPFWLILISLVFSSFVGVLAGYFPARRAMKLSALDAIRTE